MLYLKLAWRNLWRNKRRSLITIASVFFAVILSTLMMSVKNGVYDKMIDSVVGSYSGYVRIHAQGYWEEKSLDLSMKPDPDMMAKLEEHPGVHVFARRVESFALAASDEVTRGALVAGVEVEKSRVQYQLDERVIEGSYFVGEPGVLMGHGLAELLKVTVGDTIVLLGQGYHGVSAAGKYMIHGLVKFGSPELSKQLIFLPFEEAQWLYGLGDRFNSLVIEPAKHEESEILVKDLRLAIRDDYEVMSWQELNPDMVKMIATDEVEGYVFMFILYMVISFGIFGTVLMMLAERRHELGVLIAIGMKRLKLALVVFYEVLVISIIGGLAGMLGALPVCAYFYYFPIILSEDLSKMTEEYGMEPVIQASLSVEVFLRQGMVITLIGVVIGLYPFLKILRMKAIELMRS